MADITPTGYHLDPLEIPVVQEPGEWIDPERFLPFRTDCLPLHIFAKAGGE